jgi:hypothetical protein
MADEDAWGGEALERMVARKQRKIRAIGERNIQAWRVYDQQCPLEREAMEKVLSRPWPRLNKP